MVSKECMESLQNFHEVQQSSQVKSGREKTVITSPPVEGLPRQEQKLIDPGSAIAVVGGAILGAGIAEGINAPGSNRATENRNNFVSDVEKYIKKSGRIYTMTNVALTGFIAGGFLGNLLYGATIFTPFSLPYWPIVIGSGAGFAGVFFYHIQRTLRQREEDRWWD